MTPAGCGGDAITDDTGGGEAAYTDPGVQGPESVGTLDDALVNSTGTTLPVQVWFPTVEQDDGTQAHYSYEGLLTGLSMEGATPACAAPRPVVVFSHGSGGVRFQSIFLTERLASWGYVVVAPDHVGNTLFDDSVPMAEMALRRPQDVKDTFDWLVAQSGDPGSPLHGCVDPAAGYAMVGHSFGAFTSLAISGATADLDAVEAFCLEDGDAGDCSFLDDWKAEHPGETVVDLSDPRAWVSVPLTPGGYALLAEGLDQVHIPTLIFGGSLDDVTPVDTEAQPTFDDLLATPRGLAVIAGAGHLSFSDVCAFYPLVPECGADFLPPEDVHRITDALVVPFIDLARGEARAADWLPPADEPALSWTWVEN